VAWDRRNKGDTGFLTEGMLLSRSNRMNTYSPTRSPGPACRTVQFLAEVGNLTGGWLAALHRRLRTSRKPVIGWLSCGVRDAAAAAGLARTLNGMHQHGTCGIIVITGNDSGAT
jgi:hypothetical protein